jgi:hypothetical protein
MKNLYLKLLSVLFLGFIGITTYAQGTWKATGTEAAISPSTEIAIMGITNLSCMHSDANATALVGKSDAAPTVVTYNGITWDNLGLIQGATNDMFYAFLPSVSGTLDINAKMGTAKKTFIFELTDACWTFLGSTADLADLTTTFPTAGGIIATPAYFTTPSVYDTYHLSSGTWDGSTAFQSTGGNVWTVMSFAVTAGKTYIVGVLGSKFMLRGVNLAVTTSISDYKAPQMKIFPNPAAENVSINVNEPSQIGIYNTAGILMKQQLASPDQNSINISDLNPGLYFVRMNNNKIAQKLIIR